MKIRRVVIRNIRSIETLEWVLPREGAGGWNVVLGDNGSGKSSFLRSVALALIGPKEAIAARQNWNAWLRSGTDEALVQIDLIPDPTYDLFSGKGRTGDRGAVAAAVVIARDEDGVDLSERKLTAQKMPPERHVWGTGAGWFSAAYGPFRRFSGGDKDAERSFLANPKLGAHLSVFGENVALNESLYWLRELNYKKLEGQPEGNLLQHLRKFVNQKGFLPHNLKLKNISSEGVNFEDANRVEVPVEELATVTGQCLDDI